MDCNHFQPILNCLNLLFAVQKLALKLKKHVKLLKKYKKIKQKEDFTRKLAIQKPKGVRATSVSPTGAFSTGNSDPQWVTHPLQNNCLRVNLFDISPIFFCALAHLKIHVLNVIIRNSNSTNLNCYKFSCSYFIMWVDSLSKRQNILLNVHLVVGDEEDEHLLHCFGYLVKRAHRSLTSDLNRTEM